MAKSEHPSCNGVILIVEDNVAFGELVAGTLQDEGYRCHTVTSGNSALAWLASQPVSMLLLDYTLTDMTGTAFINAMQSRDITVPFVIVTGQDDSTRSEEDTAELQ